MKISFSAGRQFKSVSLIPGVDVSWGDKYCIIGFVFLIFSFSISVSAFE